MLGRGVTSARSGARPYQDVRQLRSSHQLSRDGLLCYPRLGLRLCGELGVLIFFFFLIRLGFFFFSVHVHLVFFLMLKWQLLNVRGGDLQKS